MAKTPKKAPPAFPDAGFGFDLRELRKIYAHLGSEEKLGEILKDFYQRMSRDVLIGFFFEARDVDQIAEKQKEFLLRAMGTRKTYAGKAPAVAHVALPPILTGHFDRRLKILEETLRDHGLPLEDIRSWVKFENAFRGAIVAKD